MSGGSLPLDGLGIGPWSNGYGSARELLLEDAFKLLDDLQKSNSSAKLSNTTLLRPNVFVNGFRLSKARETQPDWTILR